MGVFVDVVRSSTEVVELTAVIAGFEISSYVSSDVLHLYESLKEDY